LDSISIGDGSLIFFQGKLILASPLHFNGTRLRKGSLLNQKRRTIAAGFDYGSLLGQHNRGGLLATAHRRMCTWQIVCVVACRVHYYQGSTGAGT